MKTCLSVLLQRGIRIGFSAVLMTTLSSSPTIAIGQAQDRTPGAPEALSLRSPESLGFEDLSGAQFKHDASLKPTGTDEAARQVSGVVSNLNNDGSGSLRALLADPSVTDITFAPGLNGTIVLASELSITRSVNIAGPAGGGVAISGNNAVRVIHIGNGPTPTGTVIGIANLTIMNGRGGGGSPASTFGGGIRQIAPPGVSPTTFISNCVFVNNATASATTGSGAAVQATVGNMTLTNCTFRNNVAGNVGGAVNSQIAIVIRNCTFHNNAARTFGGAINSLANIVVSDSAFFDNATTTATDFSYGGGVMLRGANSTFTDSSFRNNANNSNGATSGGGGSGAGAVGVISTAAIPAVVSLERCTISGNRSVNRGGGVYSQNATMSLVNCTLSGNQANGDGVGGALANFAEDNPNGMDVSTLSLTNCTIAENMTERLGNGSAIFNAASVAGASASASYRNTIIGNAAAAPNVVNVQTAGIATVISDDNNICSDGTGNLNRPHDKPNADPQLGPLRNNGGATQTHLPQPGSPAIDAGRAVSGVAADQRNVVRPQDDIGVINASNGDGSDIGSVEVQATPLLTTVNDQVSLTVVSSAVTPTATCAPDAPNDVVITATLHNISHSPLDRLTFEVVELREANGVPPAVPFRLLTADAATCTTGGLVGARQTVTPGTLAPGASLQVVFRIAAPSVRRFRFAVSVLGVRSTETTAETIAPTKRTSKPNSEKRLVE